MESTISCEHYQITYAIQQNSDILEIIRGLISKALIQRAALPDGLRQFHQSVKQYFVVFTKTLTLLTIKTQEKQLQVRDVKTTRQTDLKVKSPRISSSVKVQTNVETKKKLPFTSPDTRNDLFPEKIKPRWKEKLGDKSNERVQCAQRKSNSSHTILMLLVLFILASIIQEATAVVNNRIEHIEGCYPCTELMNREWRQDLSNKCTSTIYDCGKCLEGYHANRDNEICLPKDEINVTDSSFAVVPNGASLTLSCHFNHNVDCVWKRRGFVVEISNRYSYTQANNGVNTKDCGIQISPFLGKIDYGLLECESMTDEFGLATSTSAAIQLFSEKAITMDASYSKIFTLHETVIIQCTFKQGVDCAWSRRGHLVQVKGRYSYLNAKNGIGTNDCSIKIASFHEIDVGAWQCQSVADSSTLSISSTAVELLRVDVKYPAIVVGPNTTNALIDDKVNLKCQFDAEVQCIWQHNGTESNIKNRHYFKENSSNHLKKDCSIEILNFAEADVGNWTCTYKGDHTITTASTAMINIAPMHTPTNPEIEITNTSVRISRSTNVVKGDEIVVCVSRHGNPAAELRWEMGNEHFESNQTIKRNGFLFDVEILMKLPNHQFEEGVNILRCFATHPMFKDGGTKEECIEFIIDEGNHNRGMYTIIFSCVGVASLIMTSLSIWCLYRIYRKLQIDRQAKNVHYTSLKNETEEKAVCEKVDTAKEGDAEKEPLNGFDFENENGATKDREDTTGTPEIREFTGQNDEKLHYNN